MRVQNILSINQLKEREITYFMYKYCNKRLPAAFEGRLNKNILRLIAKNLDQLEVNLICFPYFVE